MCMALYVASDREMAASEWREGDSVFCVTTLSEGEESVRDKLGRPFVMYLGAHTGCSCGFSYGLVPSETPEEEREDECGRASVAALRSFLEQQLAVSEDVELYACWEGDQGLPSEKTLEVTPTAMGGDSFELAERALYRVRRAG